MGGEYYVGIRCPRSAEDGPTLIVRASLRDSSFENVSNRKCGIRHRSG